MTHADRTIRTFALLAAAGGAAWLTKFLIILATDGAEDGAADTATSVFYILAVLLMCAGAATLTLRVANGRGRIAHVAAFVVAPFVFIASYMALDAVAVALVGDTGPSWLNDEAGIALTGAVWLAIGLASRRRSAD
jgi:hypothetical protein